jgi:hypothetical protein
MSPDAARKRVYRWKVAGIKPADLVNYFRQAVNTGICAACGDPASQEFKDKKYCGQCYLEKAEGKTL